MPKTLMKGPTVNHQAVNYLTISPWLLFTAPFVAVYIFHKPKHPDYLVTPLPLVTISCCSIIITPPCLGLKSSALTVKVQA
jgi:hypothetical protein